MGTLRYRIKTGTYSRLEGVTSRVYKPGEEVDLDEAVAKDLGAQVELVTVPAPTLEAAAKEATGKHSDGQGGAQTDPPSPTASLASTAHPIHAMSVDDAVAYVGRAKDRAAVEALRDAEAAHPRHDGGRVGVLRAISQRLADLK